jgi:transcriptional regulator with XRE-family HTH domain
MERDETALAAILARNIKAFRAERRWTQADLAQATNLTPHYIALLETAQRLPTLKALLGMAKGLGVPVDRLLASSSSNRDERSQRIATRIASAPEEMQLVIEDVVDVMIKGAARAPKKTKRKA